MLCSGTHSDHCCYLGRAGVCRYLEEGTVEGRRWACGLYRQLGSWDAVHADPRYDEIRVILRGNGHRVDCGDWPPPGVTCNTCGNANHHNG